MPTPPGAAAPRPHPAQNHQQPQPQVTAPRTPPSPSAPPRGGLPIRPLGTYLHRGGGPAWWLLACHGGAGSTTLNAAIPGGIDAGRYWPVPDAPAFTNVVLVARSHASGLRAAQNAAWQWAQGGLPTVRLIGLAVIADAPGRRPKPLKDLLKLISGGVPQVWDLPWVEDLRLGDPPDQIQLPAAFAAMAADLKKTVTGGTHA